MKAATVSIEILGREIPIEHTMFQYRTGGTTAGHAAAVMSSVPDEYDIDELRRGASIAEDSTAETLR